MDGKEKFYFLKQIELDGMTNEETCLSFQGRLRLSVTNSFRKVLKDCFLTLI